MKRLHSVLMSPKLAEVIRPLALLDDNKYEQVATLMLGEKSFDLDKNEIEFLGNILDISLVDAATMLGALSFLYDRLEDFSGDDEDRVGDVSTIISELEIFQNDEEREKAGEFAVRLSKILIHNEAHDRFLTLQRLQQGVLPRAIGFSSFVDLRPSMPLNDENNRTRIDGFACIIQLNIDTTVPVSASSSTTIQLTPADVRDLKECLSDIEQKMQLFESVTTFKDSRKMLS